MNLHRLLTAGLAALLLFAFGALPGCGGGGGVGTGGTGDGRAFVSGSVNGFGSVIVNGIRFDDSAAVVEDGDDIRRASGELRLGMTVEVESGPIQAGATGPTASATRIRFDSALLGPVQSIDMAGFTVLGQRVAVDDLTVFDDGLPARLASLRVGQLVEVYAAPDAALLRYRAVRVELRGGTPPSWRVRGLVTLVDPALQLLRIGTEVYSYAGALNVPAGLAAGRFVRVTISPTARDAQGRFVVLAFGNLLRAIGEVDDGRLKGLITAFASSTSFEVDGRPVDASGAPAVAGLALGVRVEVEGPVRGGVLRARAVAIRTDDDEREGGFELRGLVESINPGARTFVLRGFTIGTARSDLRYDPNGTGFADVTVGRRVEVRARVDLAGVPPLQATRIKFE